MEKHKIEQENQTPSPLPNGRYLVLSWKVKEKLPHLQAIKVVLDLGLKEWQEALVGHKPAPDGHYVYVGIHKQTGYSRHLLDMKVSARGKSLTSFTLKKRNAKKAFDSQFKPFKDTKKVVWGADNSTPLISTESCYDSHYDSRAPSAISLAKEDVLSCDAASKEGIVAIPISGVDEATRTGTVKSVYIMCKEIKERLEFICAAIERQEAKTSSLLESGFQKMLTSQVGISRLTQESDVLFKGRIASKKQVESLLSQAHEWKNEGKTYTTFYRKRALDTWSKPFRNKIRHDIFGMEDEMS